MKTRKHEFATYFKVIFYSFRISLFVLTVY